MSNSLQEALQLGKANVRSAIAKGQTIAINSSMNQLANLISEIRTPETCTDYEAFALAMGTIALSAEATHAVYSPLLAGADEEVLTPGTVIARVSPVRYKTLQPWIVLPFPPEKEEQMRSCRITVENRKYIGEVTVRACKLQDDSFGRRLISITPSPSASLLRDYHGMTSKVIKAEELLVGPQDMDDYIYVRYDTHGDDPVALDMREAAREALATKILVLQEVYQSRFGSE